jgi:hypothetical protein
MQIHEEIDAPPGEIYLRAGIYDMNSGNCGTVGAALNGSSAKQSKKEFEAARIGLNRHIDA